MFLEAHVSAYLSYLFVANSLVVKPKAVALSKVLLLFANTFLRNQLRGFKFLGEKLGIIDIKTWKSF